MLSLKLDVENAVQTEIDIWQNEGHIYADYIFDSAEENGYLGFFAETAAKCRYEISKDNLKKIEDVVVTVR